jgi:hypothetical protein
LNAFKNYQYTGANADNTTFTTLDRTREGYFEVLEMAVINPASSATAATVTGYIKHNTAGVPANCGALDALDASSSATIKFPNTGAVIMTPPSGGLTGRSSIINAGTGANYTMSPTALDAWSNVVAYSAVGSIFPSLTSGTAPAISNIYASQAGVPGIVTANWVFTEDAVSAAITRSSVINEFILDAGTASLTDWVVTFPTKAAYVFPELSPVSPAFAPFANNFQADGTTGACDPYNYSVFNREESSPPPTLLNPSPGAPGVGSGTTILCWEANVIPFGTTGLLGSINTNTLDPQLAGIVRTATTVPGGRTTPSLRSTQGPNGWMAMNFASVVQTLIPASATFQALGAAPVAMVSGAHNGLPVVGAMLHNYKSTGIVSLYGGVVDHKYTRNVTP